MTWRTIREFVIWATAQEPKPSTEEIWHSARSAFPHKVVGWNHIQRLVREIKDANE